MPKIISILRGDSRKSHKEHPRSRYDRRHAGATSRNLERNKRCAAAEIHLPSLLPAPLLKAQLMHMHNALATGHLRCDRCATGFHLRQRILHSIAVATTRTGRDWAASVFGPPRGGGIAWTERSFFFFKPPLAGNHFSLGEIFESLI